MKKNKKSLIKNALYNILNITFSSISPLIIYPVVLRALSPDLYGEVVYIISISQYFVLMAKLGSKRYATRQLSIIRDDEREWGQFLLEIFIILLLLTLISCVLYFIFYNTFLDGYEHNKLLLIGYIYIILEGLNIEFAYKSLELFKFISIRNIIIKMLILLLILLLVNTPSDYWKYAILLILLKSSKSIINLFSISFLPNIKKYKKIDLKRHMKPVFILAGLSIGERLYSTVDIIMLRTIGSNVLVGLYSAAYKLPLMVVTIITAFSTILMPRIAFNLKNNRKENERIIELSFKIILLFSLPASITLIYFSKELLSLYGGSNYINASNTLKILGLLIPIVAIKDLFGYQYLLANGKERLLTFSVFLGSILNIVLNIFLIKHFQTVGAAIASLSSESLILIILLSQSSELRNNISNIKNYIYLFGSLIIYLVFIMTNLNIILSIILAGIIYLLFLFIVKEEILKMIIKKIREFKYGNS